MEEKLDCRIPKSFLLVLLLFLSIKGRINFLQLERFSQRCEQGFRYFFEQDFNFFSFNKMLITSRIKTKMALAFDPIYILKAGKKTPGLGYFWSGCAGKVKWGLEFCGLAILDLERSTAFHLFGFQTPDLKDDETLISFYARKLLEKTDELLSISKYVVVDAFFSKYPFVEAFAKAGFVIISRLRDDSDLQYFFVAEQKKGRGRKRKYDGKIDFENLNMNHAILVSQVEQERIYAFKAHYKSLKSNIN